MESAKVCQDFLIEYQLLLENEKRRLNSVSDECNNVTEPVGHTSTTSAIEETDRRIVDANVLSIVQEELTASREPTIVREYHKIVVHNRLPEVGQTDVSEEQHVHESPKDVKRDNDKRTGMMDQWVTDSFYTSFPSYKKQDRNANHLADGRREDYRKYLAEISNKKQLDAARCGRRRAEVYSDSEVMFSKPPETARDKLLSDLKHSELAYNFHSSNAIDDRNQRVAMERARGKVELQQDLIKQIEEKKLRIERIRAKEREEEEILQRRLDNEMMADELANTEKVLIPNPINRMSTTKSTEPTRDIERHIDEFKADDNSPARQNRFRNNDNANSDRQIYKFFSNSAPHNDGHLNYYNQPVGFNNNMTITNPYLHHISTAAHNPAQHCNRCRRVVPIPCCHNDPNPSYFCCYQCNLLQNVDSCNNCRRVWMPSWNYHGDVDRGRFNTHHRDNHPQILEITYQDHSSQTNNSTTPPPFKGDSIQAMRPVSPDTSRNASTHTTQNHSHLTHSDKMVGIGTSMLPNIPESVSLSKEDEMLELKRKNDILIAKHAQNYGSLRNRKSFSKETTPPRHTTDDSFPLPLMREHLTTRTSSRGPDARHLSSQAVSRLEYKWEIPVVQRQTITSKPAKVLTQVGAIAKQLQLEKLNFSDD